MDDATRAEIVRSMIQHENELINHRLTWMSALHGLLIAALGFTWGKADTRGLICIFCSVGILTSVSSGRALTAGASAIEHLISWWDRNHQPGYDGPDIIGVRSSTLWRLYPWLILPVVFCLAWFGVLVLTFT